MYVHSDHENAKNQFVLDLDTGKIIGYCQWADDSTGKYCVANVVTDRFGELALEFNLDGTVKLYEKQGNIKILDGTELKKVLDEQENGKEIVLRAVVCNPDLDELHKVIDQNKRAQDTRYD